MQYSFPTTLSDLHYPLRVSVAQSTGPILWTKTECPALAVKRQVVTEIFIDFLVNAFNKTHYRDAFM